MVVSPINETILSFGFSDSSQTNDCLIPSPIGGDAPH
jgi:hypothetical protein